MDSIRKHYGESMNIAQEYVLNIMNIIKENLYINIYKDL